MSKLGTRIDGTIAAALASAFALIGAAAIAEGDAPATLDGFERHVAADGSFRFSREAASAGLAHLGSWFVPDGPAAGFHHVYTQPEAIAAYRATGSFPDGSVLVKEISAFDRANYTTGANVASATDVKQWFLMVKDTRGRFPESPLWGNGWGWALFSGSEPEKNVATDFRRDCLACHTPAQATDWVYVQGYPALRR